MQPSLVHLSFGLQVKRFAQSGDLSDLSSSSEASSVSIKKCLPGFPMLISTAEQMRRRKRLKMRIMKIAFFSFPCSKLTLCR